MNQDIELPKLACTRCGHIWISRIPRKPKQCPKCRSPYWNRPKRKKNEESNRTASDINRKYFEHRLKRIVTELICARGYIEVWEQLWPTTDKIARVENRYRNCFGFIRMALNHQFFLSLAKIIEIRKRNDNLSIWRLLIAIENEPTLLSEALNIDDLKRTLTDKQELLKSVVDYRDKELAHIDDKYHLNIVFNKDDNKKVSILLGEIKSLQKDLEEIVDKISLAYNHTHQIFESLGHDDATRLLNDTIKWLYKE